MLQARKSLHLLSVRQISTFSKTYFPYVSKLQSNFSQLIASIHLDGLWDWRKWGDSASSEGNQNNTRNNFMIPCHEGSPAATPKTITFHLRASKISLFMKVSSPYLPLSFASYFNTLGRRHMYVISTEWTAMQKLLGTKGENRVKIKLRSRSWHHWNNSFQTKFLAVLVPLLPPLSQPPSSPAVHEMSISSHLGSQHGFPWDITQLHLWEGLFQELLPNDRTDETALSSLSYIPYTYVSEFCNLKSFPCTATQTLGLCYEDTAQEIRMQITES